MAISKLCLMDSCEGKSTKIVLKVVTTTIVVLVLILLCALAITWRCKKRTEEETSTNVLTWKERLQIAVDAARGMENLHNNCKPPIVHRDLKTSNILLNQNLEAKIADFGLSKVFALESTSHVSTDPKGTSGFLDPEYDASKKLNKRSKFTALGLYCWSYSPIHLTQWVNPLYERRDIASIVDQRLQGTNYNTDAAWKAIKMVMACAQSTAVQRPDISQVYDELKECLKIEMASETTRGTQRDATR